MGMQEYKLVSPKGHRLSDGTVLEQGGCTMLTEEQAEAFGDKFILKASADAADAAAAESMAAADAAAKAAEEAAKKPQAPAKPAA